MIQVAVDAELEKRKVQENARVAEAEARAVEATRAEILAAIHAQRMARRTRDEINQMPQGDIVPTTDPTFIAVVARRGHVHFPQYSRYAESGNTFKQFDEFKGSCGFTGDLLKLCHDDTR